MQIQSILISAIEWPTRLRAIDTQRVEILKSSIGDLGLLNPITVYASEEGELILAAGAHRLKAAKALGWTFIDANVINGAEVNRQLAEIDENLCHFELTAVERALHMARRKELWVAMHATRQSLTHRCHGELDDQSLATQRHDEPQTGDQNAPPDVDARGQQKSPQQQLGFAASTALLTGNSKAAVNCLVQRGETLGDILREIVGTSLDKGVELDAMVKLTPQERTNLAARAMAGEKVSARKALAAQAHGPEDQDQHTTLVWRAMRALEKCAIAMNDGEFEIVLQHVEVPDAVERLVKVILDRVALSKNNRPGAVQSRVSGSIR